MKLVIVESPSKAKTIKKYLGTGYVVKASVGHIRDLPKSSKNAIDIEKGYVPNYEISAGKKKIVAELQEAAQKADEVLLAPDPDREGEAIAWHLEELLKASKVKAPIRRITFNEITEPAVQEALLHPRKVDTNLRKAQEARRVLDRLVGYDLSGLIWKKVRYGLSAGRVQSPALRILMEREREIRAFDPEAYFVLSGDFAKTGQKKPFLLICDEEPRDKKETERIEGLAKKKDWHVLSVKESETKRNARAPFTTSTLQQTASTRLGFSPSRTMRAAQKLYEAGHITYMRTDSPNLSQQALGMISAFVSKEYGADYSETKQYAAKSKNAQEAHEAIRPTKISKTTNLGSSGDEKALYELIWRRTVASQMTPAKLIKTKLSANITDGGIPNFSVNGSRVVFDGWLKADPAARGEDTEVPKVAEGGMLDLREFYIEAKETQPPNRYSEAGLIKELEKRGIGRPSTYASIIGTLDNRGYVEKQGRTLVPTDTGDVVSSFLEEHFMEYISDVFTAEMEDTLDNIAAGEADYVGTLEGIYQPLHAAVVSKEDIPKVTNLGEADSKFKCPTCGKSMVIKLGRTGKFLSCANYPDCEGALTLEGKELGKEEPIGKHPDSGEEIFVLEGRFGPYVQLGHTPDKKDKTAPKPRRASLPAGIQSDEVTIALATKLLMLPRELGNHPDDDEAIIANIGRFGPYVGHGREFRSLKGDDSPYTVTLERALEILKEPKALPKGVELVKVLGKHPKTGKDVRLLKSKSGHYLQKRMKRLYLDDDQVKDLDLDKAIAIIASS